VPSLVESAGGEFLIKGFPLCLSVKLLFIFKIRDRIILTE
jgi:hypothetical protein